MAEEERATAVRVQDLPEKWQQLSQRKKIAAIVMAVAIIVTLFFLGQAIARPRMALLFTGLEPVDAGRIAARLQEMNVQYSLDDEGRTILVRQDMVDDVRIQLASDESLNIGGGSGFELFDQTNLGATDFNRRMDYLRALQEELRRTIVRLDEVEQARVHLALPEPSVFIQDSAEPSASIVLALSPVSRLDSERVRGIVHLVAGSVENMRPENVTVIDTTGNILSDQLDNLDPTKQLAEATMAQLDIKRSFEKELERRVQVMLERILGPGQAIAMITADLDFDSHESTVITFDSEGVPRSQTITEEYFEGAGVVPGEAGADSNIPGYPWVGGTGDSTYERYDETTNYEINETTERQIRAPGKLVQLNASVVVNDNGGQLSQAQVRQISEAVEAALGYQVGRGDSISVQGMSFDTSHQEDAMLAMEEAARREMIERYVTIGAIALAAIIIFFVILRAFRAWRERQLEAELAALASAPKIQEEPAEEMEETPQQRLHKRVRDLAEREPESVAHLIRAWLAEE
ncbi:flagellar basal-body MS-ring/collar protein FliF [Dethiobacter alkaliphilus]|uniref:Flagellar M-ring protein n=1 Tax=Dethiobacter alkaliphilus AHT 1 TaxID=555088 RepID=C0GJI2_DETAL|nr:flagellar basal-body MS-ring/collar protein FliF [Dethiobacter alkaliphilus]EEG76529.1 flagellar M-ring protein FliF [Dethiobacter alkaliphilus AHT 1]